MLKWARILFLEHTFQTPFFCVESGITGDLLFFEITSFQLFFREGFVVLVDLNF